MSKTLNLVHDEFKQSKDAFKALMGRVNAGDATPEDLESAKSLKGKLDELKGQMDAFNDAKKYAGDLAEYEKFLNEPARDVPFPGGTKDRGHDQDFRVVGSYESGGSYFEVKNGVKELVYEDGEGLFGAKAWKAVTDPDYGRAFREVIRAKGHKENLNTKSRKLLEEGLDDQGGYTVPIDSMINRVIERKPTPTRVRGMVESYNTSREWFEMIKLNYKTDNVYTTGFRVTNTGENPTSTTQSQVTDTNLFGTIKIPVHTFMIRGLLTNNMIEDAALNVVDWMSGKFSETVEILYDDKILNGKDKMEPQGLINNIAATGNGAGLDDPLISYLPSGDASLLTPDSIIAVAEDVPEQYDVNCRYLFNKTSTHKAIRLLKDLNDRYLFGYGTQDSGLRQTGRPSDLNGYPYEWSALMPNVAAGKVPVLFGDFKGYTFVNRIGFSIKILDQPYAEQNQVALIGRVRFGGQITEPWRLRALQIGAT